MNSCLFSSATVEWATPQALFDELDAEFHFNLDPYYEDVNCSTMLMFDVFACIEQLEAEREGKSHE